MATFPELAEPPHSKVGVIDEEWMKTTEGKERWRKFINAYVRLLLSVNVYFTTAVCSYEKKITDYNFGALIRTDASDEYGEKNTIFGEF